MFTEMNISVSLKNIKNSKMARKKRKILLHAAPFFTMTILSPAEVYKKETYGFLFSFSNKNIINLAYPLQTPDRLFTYIREDEKLNEYLKKVAGTFDLTFVGDFHSHTDGFHNPATLTLSEEYDKKWLRNNPGLISIVLAINSKWSKLKVDIAGFYYNDSLDKIEEIKLIPSTKLEKILKNNEISFSRIYIPKQKKDIIRKLKKNKR